MTTTNSAVDASQMLTTDDRLRALQLRDIVDPAPEYPDEDAWTELLRIAFLDYGAAHGSPYGVLLGIRACGAQLVKVEGKGLTIQPRLSKAKKFTTPDGEGLDRDTQWQTKEDYQKDREALLPWRAEVAACLKKLAEAP